MKAPHYRRFNSKSDQGRNAELALVVRLKQHPGTMAFRTPGSKGAADVIELTIHVEEAVVHYPCKHTAHVRLIQVKSGRRPSKPEIARLEARMRAEWPFPVDVRVVWARKAEPMVSNRTKFKAAEEDGWEFVWL